MGGEGGATACTWKWARDRREELRGLGRKSGGPSKRRGRDSACSLLAIQEFRLVATAGQASHLSQLPSLPWGRASEWHSQNFCGPLSAALRVGSSRGSALPGGGDGGAQGESWGVQWWCHPAVGTAPSWGLRASLHKAGRSSTGARRTGRRGPSSCDLFSQIVICLRFASLDCNQTQLLIFS